MQRTSPRPKRVQLWEEPVAARPRKSYKLEKEAACWCRRPMRLERKSAAPSRTPQAVGLAEDDLDSAVLRLAHARAGGHQEMRLAVAVDVDRVRRHTVPDQLGLHRAGATDREALVVSRRARGVGVAVDLDPRVLDVG